MFDQLFDGPALARQRDGPLAQERRRYLEHLASLGMATTTLFTAAYYLLAVAEYLRLAERPGEAIACAEIEQAADLWVARPCRWHNRKGIAQARQRFLGRATGWLRFLGRLQLPPTKPHPHAEHLAAFADYLRRERGLSPRSIRSYCRSLEEVLGHLSASGHPLETLTITQVDQALLERITCGTYARKTVQLLATILRAFFRYAHRHGWCPSGLAEAIKAPRIFAQEALPYGPSWQDVQRLLASTQGDSPKDIRDRAVLMLLAVYGLRAGEVVRLRLEDFDWERELLVVSRLKTPRPQTYPLSRSVGDAVIRYLKEARPHCALREVFLSRRAPLRPLTGVALWPIVGRRLRALGVTLPHHGPHALRHACATHLLEQGLSLKEIGDHLGHRRPDTTRLYTKVDLSGLRQVGDFDLGGLK